tara:strand:+ start:326 stop:511 length:186 start_codon:yes stop_codon:yes gene_type:complete
MNQKNNLENSSTKTDFNNNDEMRDRNGESNIKLEKVLCNHCGRTANNGIRCLGICVADNDY